MNVLTPSAKESCPVQKLQEILHAEDAARIALDRAQEEAARIVRDAATEVAKVRADAKQRTAEAVNAHRESVLARASEEAATIGSEAEAALAVTLGEARAAIPSATEAVVRELTE